MADNYGNLIDRVDDFDNLSQIEQVKFVAYFYTIVANTEKFAGAQVSGVFSNENLTQPTNLSDCLNKLANRTPAILVKRDSSYSFHRTIKKELDSKFLSKKHVRETSETLRNLLSKVNSQEQKSFLEEAITCYEVKAHRAAIVLTWLLTVDVVFEHVLKHKLAVFNTALSKNTKFKGFAITKKEDFLEMKENDFILILGSAGIVTKEQKKILEEKLGIRNTAAHPNSIEIREAKVTSFIEDLVPNIIAKFQ